MSKLSTFVMAALLLLASPLAAAAQADHGDLHEHELAIDEDHEEGMETDDHEGHENEGTVAISPEGIKLAGVTLATVSCGNIGESIDLPGEVGFDQDRLVHVSPRFAGIAVEARQRVGEYVHAGDVIAVIESNQSLRTYSIEAAISGWILRRDITPGEFVSEEKSIYVIADLSRVWVNLAVYPKDAERVRPGQRVLIKAIGSGARAEGTIEYVTPILDVDTRSITARVVIPNPDNSWRPGTFVQAEVRADSGGESLLVKKEAVQILDDEHVVFVTEGNGLFRSMPITIGESDAEHTEVLSGLREGMEYVAKGAFELKAKIVTGSFDAHAGHGH